MPGVPLATGCGSAGGTDTHAVPAPRKRSTSSARSLSTSQDADSTSSESTAAQMDTFVRKRRIRSAVDECTARKAARPASRDVIGALPSNPDSLRREECSAAVRQRYDQLHPHFVHFFGSYDTELRGGGIGSSSVAAAAAAAHACLPGFGLSAHRAQQLRGLPLPHHLASLAADLHAASRYKGLELCSVMQHNSCTTQGLQNRKVVCSVALDRAEEYLATVGVLCFF